MPNLGQNNPPTGINVGFTASTVDFEQTAQVDQDGSISMQEFDGREEPVHARKVSVRKPEIIALFEYHPVFKEIMQGDDQEKQKVLTDAGRYIDTQITARKIRLDDIRVLFEQLSKDPESPTGKIVEDLIGVLESKITDVKNDFEAIKTVSDTVLQFLDTLDLRRPSTSQQAVFGSLRAKRFEDNTLRLPKSENKSIDFNQMMLSNLGESTSEEQDDEKNLEGSGTKMFLNFLADLDVAMHGTIIFPNVNITRRAEQDPGQSDVFNASRIPISPIVNIANGYGGPSFGGGRCSLQLEELGDSSPSFSGASVGEASTGKVEPAIGLTGFQDIFYRGRQLNSAQSCALIAQTIVDDLAASSALGDDEFVNSLSFLGSREQRGVNLAQTVTGLDIFRRAIRENRVSDLTSFETDLKGLVATALYDPDGAQGPKSPIRTFDPGVLSVPDNDGVAKSIQNTAYSQLLKPALETMQEGDNVNVVPLEAFVSSVPDALTKTATVLDQYFATSDPVLNPKSILIKVLTSIRNRIPDLNIGEDVEFTNNATAPMAAGPMIDFCLLAEASRDIKMNTAFQMNFLNNAHMLVNYERIRINDLLTMFLISLAKTSGTSGKYSSVIPVQQADIDAGTLNFFTIGRHLAKHIRMNLLNTYTNRPIGIGKTVAGVAVNSAIDAMSKSDSDSSSDVTLAYGSDSSGVTSADFAGSEFSPSRRKNDNRVTRWRTIIEKLSLDIENEEINVIGGGSLFRPDPVDDERNGNAAGTGIFNAVRTGGAFDISPIKRIYGSQIEERLTGVVGLNRNESIFSDIVDVVDEIYDAAAARGPIVDAQTGKMISSGVDPAYIMSFVISLYSIIIKDLVLVRFSPTRAYYATNRRNHPRPHANLGNHNAGSKSLWEEQDRKTMTLLQIANITRSREFIFTLNNFLTAEGEVESIPDPSSPLGRFLSRFNEQVDGSTRIRLDAIDMLRTLGDSLSTAANKYIESFVNDNNQIRVDEQFERIKAVLPLAIDRTQVTAMRNQLQSVTSKEGFGKFFDDFMLSQAQENVFYGSLLGLGQGSQTALLSGEGMTSPLNQISDKNRVDFTKDRNTGILTFGIPQGFSKAVLGIDPVLEPMRFNERLVDVYVVGRDHLSGQAISIIPQPYTFDLALFFDSVSDPVVSSTETNSQLNEVTSPEFLSNFNQSIANRKYPVREEIFQSNVKMRRLLLKEGKTKVVSRPADNSIDQIVFDNHVYDMLARTYAKVTTGMSVTENDFFIDPSIEQRLATEPDLRNLSNLMNTHISQLLGRDVTFNDYLAGDRRFRELLNRLSKGEKTGQIIDEIKVNLEGVTEDANTLSSEDLVAFSRMITSNNPIITPGLFRDKIVSPRLFERVFSIFVNPDKFIALPFPADLSSNAKKSEMTQLARFLRREIEDEDSVDRAVGEGVSARRVTRDRVSSGRLHQEVMGFNNNQRRPTATMYQVLVVPHDTLVDFFSSGEE